LSDLSFGKSGRLVARGKINMASGAKNMVSGANDTNGLILSAPGHRPTRLPETEGYQLDETFFSSDRHVMSDQKKIFFFSCNIVPTF
jgi:hypothetical protein